MPPHRGPGRKLRDHIAAQHRDWSEASSEIDDDLLVSYHRADHERCDADKRHTHEEFLKKK